MRDNGMQDLCDLLWFASDESTDYGLGPDFHQLEHDFLNSKEGSSAFLSRYLTLAERIRNRDEVRRSCMFPQIQQELKKIPGIGDHSSWLLVGAARL